MVTLYSPMIMVADMVENYESHPALKFITDYNPDIDESIFLEGDIGEYIAIARRSGKDWYIGATTGEQERTLSISLSFLTEGTKYQAEVYQDSSLTHCVTSPETYDFSSKVVTSQTSLQLYMAACGGAAVRLSPLVN